MSYYIIASVLYLIVTYCFVSYGCLLRCIVSGCIISNCHVPHCHIMFCGSCHTHRIISIISCCMESIIFDPLYLIFLFHFLWFSNVLHPTIFYCLIAMYHVISSCVIPYPIIFINHIVSTILIFSSFVIILYCSDVQINTNILILPIPHFYALKSILKLKYFWYFIQTVESNSTIEILF